MRFVAQSVQMVLKTLRKHLQVYAVHAGAALVGVNLEPSLPHREIGENSR
jgi:hypothetical protein